MAAFSKKLVEELDRLLGKYYESKNRTDYSGKDDIGKFRAFCEEHGIYDDMLEDMFEDMLNNICGQDNGTGEDDDDDEWPEWLAREDDIDLDKFIGTDDNCDFPCFERLPDADSVRHKKEQFLHLFQQLYELRIVPSDVDLRRSFFQNLSNKFRASISWSNIVESLKHELCEAISTKMDGVVVDMESKQLIEASLQNRKLSDKEVKFIRNAVERAKKFKAASDGLLNSSVISKSSHFVYGMKSSLY